MRLDQFARQDLSRTGSIQDELLGMFLDPDVRLIHRSGTNVDVDTSTTPEDIWGNAGLYTGFPAAAEAVRVTSSSADDTAAGTGARTVILNGLDANGNFLAETVTLNGTTPVVTVNSFLRLNRAYVATSGSGNTAFNAGTITIQHNVTTANVFATIDIGIGAARTTAYTIPANTTGVLTQLSASGVRASSTFNGVVALYMRLPSSAPILSEQMDISDSLSVSHSIRGGIYLPAGTDVILRVLTTSANNIVVSGSLEITLIRNS
jgi:hypothetical protein